MPSATDLLREDHRRVKDLFRQFEDAEGAAEKGRIAQQTFMELEIHSQIEEEIFYPAIRRQDKEEMADIMNEADEEHHVVDVLIAEMKKMRPSDPRFEAKFKVMAENVKHHIQEEESEIFTKAAEEGGDRLQRLGQELESRKAELMARSSRRQAASRSSSARKAGGAARPSSSGSTRKRTTASKNGARTKRTMTKTARRAGSAAASSARKTARKAVGAARKAAGSSRRSATSSRARKARAGSR